MTAEQVTAEVLEGGAELVIHVGDIAVSLSALLPLRNFQHCELMFAFYFTFTSSFNTSVPGALNRLVYVLFMSTTRTVRCMNLLSASCSQRGTLLHILNDKDPACIDILKVLNGATRAIVQLVNQKTAQMCSTLMGSTRYGTHFWRKLVSLVSEGVTHILFVCKTIIEQLITRKVFRALSFACNQNNLHVNSEKAQQGCTSFDQDHAFT